jgi:hypothetical protein
VARLVSFLGWATRQDRTGLATEGGTCIYGWMDGFLGLGEVEGMWKGSGCGREVDVEVECGFAGGVYRLGRGLMEW